MSDTSIEWTDKTWNPTVGCTRISAGCKNCYAFALHDMRHAAYKAGKKLPEQYAKPFTELQMMEDRLQDPLRWRKPCRVFVNSVSDLFHEDVPYQFIDRVFAVMALAPQHTFQVLTKRAQRMRDYLFTVQNDDKDLQRFANAACELTQSPCASGVFDEIEWPFPNVWLGTSVENQEQADKRIPLLLQTPAAVRFLSMEPLLGPVVLDSGAGSGGPPRYLSVEIDHAEDTKIDWAIVGGESGHNARPMHPDWARSLRDQCQAAGVPFFFKQHGEWCAFTDIPNVGSIDLESYETQSAGRHSIHRVGKKAAGRQLDGREWSEFPEVAHA